MIRTINSAHNPLIKKLRSFNSPHTQFSRLDSFMVEGEKSVRDALEQHAAETLILDAEKEQQFRSLLEVTPDIDTVLLPRSLFESISHVKTPQGILCICRKDHPFPVPRFPLCSVALNGVQDPGNVGTILRTAEAAGFGTVYLDPSCASPYSWKSLSASMGSIFRIRTQTVPSIPSLLTQLHHMGISSFAGDLKGEDFFSRPPAKSGVCIVIGSEGNGISEEVRQTVDYRCRLPIYGGADSLNAAISAGIFIYGILRDYQTEGIV